MKIIPLTATLLATFGLVAPSVGAEEIDLGHLPAPVDRPVDYATEIEPIFQRACFRCHGANRPKSGFRLDNRADAMKGGDTGLALVAGESGRSPLVHYAAYLVEDMEMPPVGKAEPLTAEEISLLRAWIDQGAVYTSLPPPPKQTFQLTPSVGYIFVEGDRARFQEHHWRRAGRQGGVDHFRLEERLSDETRFVADGHALRDDYAVRLDVHRDHVGFVRAGFQRWSRYYDDNGGYFPGLPELESESGLRLDFTKIWVEAGLERPGRPRWVVGYELDQRDGNKSLTQWLPTMVSPFQLLRLGPATKQIDEQRHLLRLDVSHDVGGVFVEDNFRYEFYDLDTKRTSYTPFLIPFAPGSPVDAREQHEHRQLANTLRAEKQLKDWLFVSGGHLYTRTDGEAGVDLNTPQVVAPLPGVFWSGQGLILKHWAHVMNLNARFGPWQGLTFTAGLQSEWSRQEGAGDVFLDEGDPGLGPLLSVPATLDANQSTFQAEEHFGLRYTQIPFTVLFFESRLRQQRVAQYEEQLGGPGEFLRNTDVERDLADFRAGFQVSPWRRVAFSGHYRRRYSDSDYDHRRDQRPIGVPGFGYSAFILGQELITDETEARLVVRPLDWLKTTFSYRWMATDYETETDAAAGTTALTGNSDVHVASFGTVISPWRRLSLSGTFSYSQTRTVTLANNEPSVVPFKGTVYSVLGYAGYTLNAKTFLTGTYSFSRGDYAQDNFSAGLPLGLEYDQHTATAGIRRTIGEQVTLGLRYAFYRYAEPSRGGQNDYNAHGIFASLAMRWPGE